MEGCTPSGKRNRKMHDKMFATKIKNVAEFCRVVCYCVAMQISPPPCPAGFTVTTISKGSLRTFLQNTLGSNYERKN